MEKDNYLSEPKRILRRGLEARGLKLHSVKFDVNGNYEVINDPLGKAHTIPRAIVDDSHTKEVPKLAALLDKIAGK